MFRKWHLMWRCRFVTSGKDQTLSKSRRERTAGCSLLVDRAENAAFKLNGTRGRAFIVWSNMFEFFTLQIGADGGLRSLMPTHTIHIKSPFALFVEVSLYSVFIYIIYGCDLIGIHRKLYVKLSYFTFLLRLDKH